MASFSPASSSVPGVGDGEAAPDAAWAATAVTPKQMMMSEKTRRLTRTSGRFPVRVFNGVFFGSLGQAGVDQHRYFREEIGLPEAQGFFSVPFEPFAQVTLEVK